MIVRNAGQCGGGHDRVGKEGRCIALKTHRLGNQAFQIGKMGGALAPCGFEVFRSRAMVVGQVLDRALFRNRN